MARTNQAPMRRKATVSVNVRQADNGGFVVTTESYDWKVGSSKTLVAKDMDELTSVIAKAFGTKPETDSKAEDAKEGMGD